jgi:hypothetical protein
MTDTHIDTSIEMVAVDMVDVAELAEICDYVRDWVGGAPPAVNASLTRFGGPDAKAILLEALGRLADVLVRAVPCVSPTGVQSPTSLGHGETPGLAELLATLSVNGWPADADHAQALADDCHRWAARLGNTPGMVE